MTKTIRAGVSCFIRAGRGCLLGLGVVLFGINFEALAYDEEAVSRLEDARDTRMNELMNTPTPVQPKSNGQPDNMNAIKFSPEGLQVSKRLQLFQKSMKEYSEAAIKCGEDKAEAENACEDSKSPILHSIKANLANATAAIGAVMGSKDPCSKFADAMKGAAALLPMFGQSCSSGIASCKGSCGTALSALRKLVNTNVAAKDELTAKSSSQTTSYTPESAMQDAVKIDQATKIANEELLHNDDTPEGNRAFCAVRAMSMMAQGIQQANGAMMGMGQGGECNKETTGTTAANDGLKPLGPDSSEAYCAAHPAEPQCNCSLAQNASTKRCLCLSDMRNPYCNNGLASGRDGSLQKLGVGSGGAIGAGSSGKSALNLDDGMEEEQKITLPPKGGDEPPARGGGGGGGMAGSGGSGNQLGGPGGGGGTPAISKTTNPGGWMAGGGSPSKLSNNDDEAGKKRGGVANKADQNKVAAAEFAKQVSPLGGRTNWEKVKIRYIDNARTLIQK
ncbi:MAG: hypothetical protein JNM39_06965 [Bdellovibrionaceae bacterium]|nr:hypothetical protein [Pseudobdellovibrionaceae bacterium]